MSSREQLITWLNSAYAMEQAQIKVLENHAKDAAKIPEIRERDDDHLVKTRGHADSVRECLRLLGETPSSMKSAMGNVMGMVQGASTGVFTDELLKNCLHDYASEHFEIACYRSLIAAATELGQPEIARLCGDILRDEEEMALWLNESIPKVTRMTLHQLTHA
ncbi:MAG TPA: ferritin-like domain-containing protein [Opitutaceae bacterium]